MDSICKTKNVKENSYTNGSLVTTGRDKKRREYGWYGIWKNLVEEMTLKLEGLL